MSIRFCNGHFLSVFTFLFLAPELCSQKPFRFSEHIKYRWTSIRACFHVKWRLLFVHPSRELVPKLSGACPCCVTSYVTLSRLFFLASIPGILSFTLHIFPPLHIIIQHTDTWARWSVERNAQFNRKPRSYKL